MIKGYKKPTPCWYMGPDSFYSYEEGDENFLPGGIGDSSIDVNGNVNISDKNLTKLPLKFRDEPSLFIV